MKKLLFILGLSLCAVGPVAFTGCSTPVSQRTVEVQTLGALGIAAKGTMDQASLALKNGTITVAQWQAVANFYDTKFQPAYNLALSAVNSDLSSVASPDLVGLASQLATLLSSYAK